MQQSIKKEAKKAFEETDDSGECTVGKRCGDQSVKKARSVDGQVK